MLGTRFLELNVDFQVDKCENNRRGILEDTLATLDFAITFERLGQIFDSRHQKVSRKILDSEIQRHLGILLRKIVLHQKRT